MYDTQTLINCVGSFSIVKLILVLVVLALLMYTCHQKFAKNGPRVLGLDDSRTKKEKTIPEKVSDTMGIGAKKRRRRKKKPSKENSEEQEQPNAGNQAREHTDTSTGEEVKVVKIRNIVANSVKDIGDVKKRKKVSRKTGSDGDVSGTLRLDNKNTKNAETTGRVEAKDRKKGDNDPNKSENPEDSWTVKGVKEVKNTGGGSDRLIRNAPCSVFDQDTVCQNEKQPNGSSPRCAYKLYDASGEGVVKRDSPSLNNSDSRCDAAPRQRQLFLAHKTKKVPSVNGTEHKKIDRQDDGAKNQTQERFSSDSPEGQPSKLNTNADHQRRGTAPRRGSFDCNARKGPRENEHFESHRHSPTVNQTRRRSFDRSSEKDPRQSDPLDNNLHPTDHQRRRRSSDHTAESDLRQSELSENSRCKRTRRRSFDHTAENDPKGHGLQENQRDCPTDDHTSESDHRENYRHPTDNRARRGSSNHTSEDVSKGGELPEKQRQFTDNRRRQRSFDHTSKSDPRHEILENHRHPIDNGTRRKSFDRPSGNDTTSSGLPENRRHCPTDSSTSAKSEKTPDEKEQERTNRSTTPSPVQDAVVDPAEAPFTVHKAELEHSVEAAEDIKAANRPDGQETLGDQHRQFVIDPEVRERIANPKYPVRVPDKPLEHLSYRDDSWRPDHIKGANKSLVGGLFGKKWREEMERKKLKEEMEEAAEEERCKAEMMKFRDCPTFMVWGVCHRGDHCPLRHPSYRYLERPPRKVVSPDPAPEEPKRHPNSYASILEKRNSTEPKEFFNEAVLYQAETANTNRTSYSKALVNLRQGQQTSNGTVTKASYEENWPSLGCAVQGRSVKTTKQAPLNVPEAWTAHKGPQIVDEKPRIDKLQTTSDAMIAQELQADEYTLDEYDDAFTYYPEDEFGEDSFYHQVHDDTHEDDESSPNTHHDAKVLELEQFDKSHFQSSPVIIEQSSSHTEDPSPPRVVSSPCDICMDRPKDATLVCGHRFCYVCALQMRLDERVCAICRRCIVSVIKTYN